jgi:C1A family cysteine protease
VSRRLNGWRRDRPDPRDYRVGTVRSYVRALGIPSFVDLSVGRLPRVEDQGLIGSCTLNAATSAEEYLEIKAGRPVTELSRLFAYYATRVWVEHQAPGEDGGAEIRDAMKALATFGVCSERSWPYDPAKFSRCPPPEAIVEAKHRTIVTYWRCPRLTSIRVSLALGYPVVGGFSCFESLESDDTTRTGLVKMPADGEPVIGGHAVLFVGYSDRDQLLRFENSWGIGWGERGFGFLPYDYVRQGLADDFWTIRGTGGA